MSDARRSRVGILSTLSDLHTQPITYDIRCLQTLVSEINPDLLCAEITRQEWEKGDLSSAAVEVRRALAPIVALTDVVLIPVAPSSAQFADFAPAGGWRRALVRSFDRLLEWAQRRADRPKVINSLMFEAFCQTVCHLTEMAWSARDRAVWEAQNQAMAENIIAAIQRDAGRRVLVVVQCQRVHRLEPLLKQQAHILELVNYWEL